MPDSSRLAATPVSNETSRFFCAEQARFREERIFGTAPQVNRWLLITHPAAWSEKSLPDDRLPSEVRRNLRRAVQQLQGCRELMIRQDYQRESDICWCVVESSEQRPSAFWGRVGSYGELRPNELLDFRNRKPQHGSFFLTCTHGKHDKCCAKFGFRVHQALRALVGEQAWECSHVGGDRFAGNVIWMPYGIYFGHVFEADVKELVDACNQGRILLQHYRGRCCYSHIEQAAEYFIRSESGLLAINDLVWRGTEELNPGHWRVRFQSTWTEDTHVVEMRATTSSQRFRLTCKAQTANSTLQYELCSYRRR